MIDRNEYYVRWIHKTCGETAIYCKIYHSAGDLIQSYQFIYPDGRKPIFGGLSLCFHCNENLQPFVKAHILRKKKCRRRHAKSN